MLIIEYRYLSRIQKALRTQFIIVRRNHRKDCLISTFENSDDILKDLNLNSTTLSFKLNFVVKIDPDHWKRIS